MESRFLYSNVCADTFKYLLTKKNIYILIIEINSLLHFGFEVFRTNGALHTLAIHTEVHIVLTLFEQRQIFQEYRFALSVTIWANRFVACNLKWYYCCLLYKHYNKSTNKWRGCANLEITKRSKDIHYTCVAYLPALTPMASIPASSKNTMATFMVRKL